MASKRPRGTGSIYKRGYIYWVKYHVRGKPYRESSDSTKVEDAQRLLKKRLGQAEMGTFQGPKPDRVTLGELAGILLLLIRSTGRSL